MKTIDSGRAFRVLFRTYPEGDPRSSLVLRGELFEKRKKAVNWCRNNWYTKSRHHCGMVIQHPDGTQFAYIHEEA